MLLANSTDRGIGNLILSSLINPANANKNLHFYSSSGGNAGLAAVIAARDLGCPCTVVVPLTTKPMMMAKLRVAGAEDVIQYGASWFEADTYLRETFINNQDDNYEQQVKNIYVPPFDHPEIWEGVSTIIPEIAAQLPPDESGSGSGSSFPADVIVCSVGGGGLFNGIIHGLEKHIQSNPRRDKKPIHVLAAETNGADSLALSLRNGSLQALPEITSLATSLGALCVAPQTLENAQSPPSGVQVTSVVGSDAEAARGVIRLADEMRLLVELACGISVEVAAQRLREVVKDLTPETRVVVVVCGGSSVTAEMVAKYRQKLESGWE